MRRQGRGERGGASARAALALVLFASALSAQDPSGAPAPDPFGAPAPDPFGAPAPDPFGAPAPDPFAGVGAVQSSAPTFDPDAVRVGAAPGVWLGPVELHGRVNLTLSVTDGHDHVELLHGSSLELSSADLYAQWFPCPWFGLLGEVELESDLHEDERAVEVEGELLVAEVRPLGDDRLRLRAGYFPVPFGLERRHYAPARNALANRPAAFRRVYPGDYVDWGVALWGRQALPWGGEVELEAALVRGLEGPLRREDRPGFLERDDNHEPMFAGRLGWTPFALEPTDGGLAALLGVPLRLTLGASLLVGHHDDEATARLRVLGFDAGVTVGELSARVEVVLAELEAGRQGPSRDVRAEGLYALLVWRRRFGLRWLEEGYVALRYDLADPDTRARDGSDVERWHVGLGWVPEPGWLVKLGFEAGREGAERPRTVYFEVGYSF